MMYYFCAGTAIVTGGATGIGRATTLALAQAGATVAVGSRTASRSAFADVAPQHGGQIVTFLST
ncbi:MAG: SDR family NAD(P)-dependent oxidoreductase [Caldilineaceae bacterium]